jgi:adenosylhomocysteine nucleosidase
VSATPTGTAVGVVTGLRFEARCLRGLQLSIRYSGGSAERARAETAGLVANGAAALVSFGLAGGLAPDLRAGDLLLPETVCTPAGGSASTDRAWRERLDARLTAHGLRVRGGPIAGSDRVIASPGEKRALLAATGAAAVDMESHAVAVVASARGLPFLVLRAIADAADRAIPQTAIETLRPDGNIRALAVLGGVIRQPGQLFALLRLARDTAAALRTLRRAAVLAGPALGPEG